jgi:hypothetical protein
MNQTRRILFSTILYALLVTSCATIKNDPKRAFIKLEKTDFKKLDGQFSNYPTTLERNIDREMSSPNYTPLTLWSQLDEYQYKDSIVTLKEQIVTLDFVSSRKAVAKLWDSEELIKTKKVKGKIRNGYFYYRNHFMVFPLFPIIFGYNTYQYRIGLTTKDSIVIDHKWNNWGFAISAGGFSKGQTSAEFGRK